VNAEPAARMPTLLARASTPGKGPVGGTRVQRRSTSYGAGVWALVALLTCLALPMAAHGVVPIDVFGIHGDFTWVQLAIIGGSIATIVASRVVVLTRFAVLVVTAATLVVTYDVGVVLVGGSDFKDAALRGVLNIMANGLAVVAFACAFSRRRVRDAVLRAVPRFGPILALSTIFEYALLKLSTPLLVLWRQLLNSGVDADNLLTYGGVTLRDEGLSRVGGLCGAPEVTGFVLSLTLPFLLLQSRRGVLPAHIVVLYSLAVILTGSRTLAITMMLSAAALALGNRRARRWAVRAAAAIVLVAIVAVTLGGINPEVANRVGADAWQYELDWRLERTTNLIAATRILPSANPGGFALGLGAEGIFRLPPVTAGLLGGDYVIAAALGGLAGIGMIAIMWAALLSTWTWSRSSDRAGLQAGTRLYLAIVFAMSLSTPVLMQLVFGTSLFTTLLLAYPSMIEAMARSDHASSRRTSLVAAPDPSSLATGAE
jgi:hypothetical protein